MDSLERFDGDDEQTKDKARPVLQAMGLMATAVLSVFLATLLFIDSALASPGGRGRALGKVSDEVVLAAEDDAPFDLVPVIVQTYGDAGDVDLLLAKNHGAVVRARHSAIFGYSALVPAGSLDDLALDPKVERISLDAPVHSQLDIAVRAARGGFLLDAANGDDGRGVGIALIDTGVQLHPDLVRARPDGLIEVEVVGREKGFADYYGHGTHVAGILNGSGLDSSGPQAFRTFRGVAPGARLISLRALNPDGTGTTSDVLRAVDWTILHRRQYNIRVLNLSLGHPVYESFATDPLCRAVRAATNAGIVVVVAAGNLGNVGSGFGTILSPANEPSAVTVGAMDDGRTVAREDDVLARFSARGPSLIDHVVKPDLVAPGAFIVSLRAVGSALDVTHPETVLPTGAYRTDGDRARPGEYTMFSGTSLAAPMVSGAAAVMLQREPGLRPSDVKARLMASASKDDHLPFETGAGYLDIEAALASRVSASSALSPVAVPGPDGNLVVQPLEGSWDSSWQQGLIWGGQRFFGTLMATENDQVTSSGIVWSGNGARLAGVDTLTASGILWAGGGK
ncbi:MAG TPA: S8 family peptidase [Verrucomicrobiae bacterium]|nr:S8 family peptidase [Verrucomicrobiae bacterium]